MTQISMVGHTMKGYKDTGEVYVFDFFFGLFVLICFILRTVLLGIAKSDFSSQYAAVLSTSPLFCLGN